MAEKKPIPKEAAPKKAAPKNAAPTKAIEKPEREMAVRKNDSEIAAAAVSRKSLEDMLARYSDESEVYEVFTTMNDVIIKLTGEFKVDLWTIGTSKMYKGETLADLLKTIDLSIDPVVDDEISKNIIRDNDLDKKIMKQPLSMESYCYLSCLIEKYNFHQIYYTDGTKRPNEGISYDIFVPDESNIEKIHSYIKNAKRLVRVEQKNKQLFDELLKEIDKDWDVIVIIGYSISY